MDRQAQPERAPEGRRKPRGPSRQGLVEYLLVTGFLLVAAAGAVTIFGEELRGVFGVRTAPATLPATQGPPRQTVPSP
jgi:hypothetical protein